ncbi:MAG TPA: hypothetical protein VMT30_08550 [Candidatus Saccharimonadia bacterium]|nr:hypothetical protein [Candidatus Saccharimonadia bacterium]
MDTQTLMPDSSGPFNTAPGRGGSGRPAGILIILVLLLGLGTVGFGVLTLTFSSKAATATKTLEAQKAAAAAKARDEQKKTDQADFTKQNESPFRSYTAPEPFGAFVINFPKTWTSTVDEENTGTQVKLIVNPDFVRRKNGQDDKIAAKVIFLDQPKDKYLAQYASLFKKGTLKQSSTEVSGQPAINIVGQFGDLKTVRLVVVPIRDKVLLFSTENDQLSTEFNQIISQAKINP